jgi:hypothetical protein
MKVIFKHGNGIVIQYVNELPEKYIEWSDELQIKYDYFIKAVINEDYTDIIEGATEEEIKEYEKSLVPTTLHRMGFKIQLLIKGIKIDDIIETINHIPDYMFPPLEKQIAVIKFQEAAYFDRYNADLQLVATLMGLSQDDLDDIFINGNKL